MQKSGFISKNFKTWIWISHILMDAFIGNKSSPMLMFHLLTEEKKHQKIMVFFYSTLLIITSLFISLSLYYLLTIKASNLFLLFFITISVISFFSETILLLDSLRKFKLLSNILTSSKTVQEQYRCDTQVFISYVTKMFNIDISHDFLNLKTIHDTNIEKKSKKKL